jgi:hypothetical protein
VARRKSRQLTTGRLQPLRLFSTLLAFSQATTVVLGRHPNDDADAICHPPIGNYPREQAINFLGRPLGAKSLSGFWQYWNPVWSYFLLFFCYRLLRKNLPRWLSIVLTFFLCGLLHDLPIGILSYAKVGRPPYFTITVFLTLNGLLVVLSEKFGFRLTRVPTGMRWLIHVAILVACYLAALHLTTWIAIG